MAANPDKFQAIFMGLEKCQKLSLEINGQPIKTTEEVKLLGITTDSKLLFRNHVGAICKTANQKNRHSLVLPGTYKNLKLMYYTRHLLNQHVIVVH